MFPEGMFDLKYGVAGICVMLTVLVLVQAAKFVLSVKAEKDKISQKSLEELIDAVDSLTIAMNILKVRIDEAEKSLGLLPKFNTDVRRFYAAIKALAGDKWPAIRNEILEDDFTL